MSKINEKDVKEKILININAILPYINMQNVTESNIKKSIIVKNLSQAYNYLKEVGEQNE